VINEVLARPHYDWQGTGGVSIADEFIELLNLGPHSVNLAGWMLDDIADGGSRPFRFPPRIIKVGEHIATFKSRSHLTLNDNGDGVRLLVPNGREVDRISYLKIKAANLSYGRIPDGSGTLRYGLWPTSRQANLSFVEPLTAGGRPTIVPPCPGGGYPQAMLLRLARHPSIVRWLWPMGRVRCP
jgi:hypothetical protein